MEKISELAMAVLSAIVQSAVFLVILFMLFISFVSILIPTKKR